MQLKRAMDNNEKNVSSVTEPSASVKRKIFLRNFFITLGIGAAVSVGFMFILGAFSQTETYQTYRAFHNSFFVSGVILICMGLLVISANAGTFTILGYGVSLWGKLLHKEISAESRSYYNYRERRLANKKPFVHFLAAGGVLVLIAIVFLILCKTNEPSVTDVPEL